MKILVVDLKFHFVCREGFCSKLPLLINDGNHWQAKYWTWGFEGGNPSSLTWLVWDRPKLLHLCMKKGFPCGLLRFLSYYNKFTPTPNKYRTYIWVRCCFWFWIVIQIEGGQAMKLLDWALWSNVGSSTSMRFTYPPLFTTQSMVWDI